LCINTCIDHQYHCQCSDLIHTCTKGDFIRITESEPFLRNRCNDSISVRYFVIVIEEISVNTPTRTIDCVFGMEESELLDNLSKFFFPPVNQIPRQKSQKLLFDVC